MIIDSHVHADETSQGMSWVVPSKWILDYMDEAGIEKAITMSMMDAPGAGDPSPEAPIEYTAELVRKYPDRFWGYARIATWYGDRAIRLFEKAILEYGLVGLKLHPATTVDGPASATSAAIIKRAAELKVPVNFHSGDDSLSTPYEIELAAKACPDATFILSHMGGYWHVADCIEAAARTPNMYLDTSCMPYPALIRTAVRRLGAERVLFASDGPGAHPRLEIFKVKRAGLTEQEESLVFSGNILRILEAAKR
jgi:uncharacterized protein